MEVDAGGMFAEERKLKIVDYIARKGKATVKQLCDYFDVSSATIRNDLRELDRKGQIARTHGGAMVREQAARETVILERETEHVAEKRSIALAALDLIEDGDTIALDTGTTTRELAKVLGRHRPLTVITNDLNIALILEDVPGMNVVVMGGILRHNFHCTVGEAGRRLVSTLRVDKAFMGANAFSVSTGASTPDLHTAETKRSMISIAGKVVLLCGSEKINHRSFATFASVEEIDTLITDAIDPKTQAELDDHDVEVIVAH